METALLAATEKNETNTVISLLKQGANINATDSQGRTPLMIATYKNDVKTAKALIKAGADVNIQDDMKNNPFLYAGAEGYLDILKLTIDLRCRSYDYKSLRRNSSYPSFRTWLY